MKKILLSLFALMAVSFSAMAQTELKITFPLTNQTSVSAYSSNWTGVDVNGDTWRFVNFNNNKNGWAYIKCGWKTEATTSVISSPLIAEAVTEYAIIVDKTANVTSAKLEVLKSDSATIIETKNITLAAGTIKVELTGSENAYYRLSIENEKVSSNGTTQISAITLTKAASSDTATKPALTGSGIFTTATFDVTITNKETGSTVYYTTDGNDPTTSSESFTGDSKTITINGTTTVKAMSVVSGKANSTVASATYTYEESIANDSATAYTVAQIKDIIDAGSAQLKTTNVFVKGKVSKVDSYNSTYGSITYWISDDGETTSQQFEVYGGLSFNGEKFASISEIQVGDTVIAKGYATFYSSLSVYEFSANNTLIYRTEHSKKTPTLTATYKTSLNVGETDNVVVSYDGDGQVSVESSNPDIADVDGGEGSTTYLGAYQEGSTTISITAPETDNYYGATITYTLTVKTPMGGLETFTNGGFETWSSDSYATGWKSTTSASSATVSKSTDARSGNYSAQIASATANKRIGSKEFKLPAGHYTFEAYVKPVTATDTINVAAGFVPDTLTTDGVYKANGNAYNYGSYATVSGSEWVKVSKTFYLDKDSVINLVVMNRYYNKKYGKAALVDDANLREATAEEIDQMTGVATFEYTPEAMTSESVYFFEGSTPSVTWKSGNRFTFSTYTDDYGEYGKYYYSYAISNKTTTTGKLSDYALESACGGAKNGNNYAVWYNNWYGDSITLATPGAITGFYVTNTTSVVDAIINGDGMSTVAGGFQNGDSLTLNVIGYDAEGAVTDTVSYKLAYAENGTIYYVNDWRWVDLKALGSVSYIKTVMTSTKVNDYGMTTPAYFCVDDFGGTKPETDAEYAEATAATGINSINANVNAANRDGKFIQNGRMVIVKAGKTYNVSGQIVK